MSQTSIDARTSAERWQHYNVTLDTTGNVLLAWLYEAGFAPPATNLSIIQVVLVADGDFLIAHSSTGDFKTISSGTEKIIPLTNARDIFVKAATGTPTLSVEVYMA